MKEKEVTLSFTAAELLELAKHLNLGGVFITDEDENEVFCANLLAKICAVGYKEFNDQGDYELTENADCPFGLSQAFEEKVCEPLLDEFQIGTATRYIANGLASRDFSQKYNQITMEDLVTKPELAADHNDMQNAYEWELMLNGLDNFYLVKKKPRKKKQ